ncbi:MAG TPA: hypothetical protein P5205_07680 [Candidatus Paceibacterota bacterium]|nr:hypothetical protein [Verrucomicrobiota bacterium]HSA10237.1 hypothetical protein [Candidatus Paceibacterota bacterium]
MKQLIALSAAVISLLGASQAQELTDTWTQTPSPGAIIPDDNPTGVTFTQFIDWEGEHGIGWTFTDVNVIFTVTGGWNGDLYAHLSYDYAPTPVPLLNRVGSGNPPDAGEPQYTFGFDTAGFPNVKLDDQAANGPVHLVQIPQAGLAYQPDHGTVTLNGGFLDALNEHPNGEWTIFFSDLSGNFESTLASWTVEITAVIPEPGSLALGLVGGAMVLLARARNNRLRRR